MIDFFVNLVLNLNHLLFDNLGLTIIVIAIGSRIITHPFMASSLRHMKTMRDLKPKLDELKRKHGSNRTKHMEEQAKLFKEAGTNPAAGCLPQLVQIGVLLLLFQILHKLLELDVNTQFFIWDLGRPDTFNVSGIPFGIPGILVLLTTVATLLQSKMSLPEPVKVNKEDSKREKEEKQDFASALEASQGQLVFLAPLFFLLWAGFLPAGLFLYWLVSTIFGIFQQYYLAGLGGLRGWLFWMKKK